MTKGMPPPAPDAPEQDPGPGPAVPTTVVVWIHDGPVCVTVVDLPPPHVGGGACNCAACSAHEPERAIRWF